MREMEGRPPARGLPKVVEELSAPNVGLSIDKVLLLRPTSEDLTDIDIVLGVVLDAVRTVRYVMRLFFV